MKKPETTLFMLMSVDGKISAGDAEDMDVDRDFPKITGVKEGLKQYYDLEQETDLFSLNTGRVFAKVGVNDTSEEPTKRSVSFVVIDNRPHLTERGVSYLAKKAKKLIIVTTNRYHPAFSLQESFSNFDILSYLKEIDFENLFEQLLEKYEVLRITVQSGGTLNATLIRKGLIDRLSIVVAPVLVGGKDTPTLMDGESLHSITELMKLKPLRLVSCKPLEDSYVHIQYNVVN